MAGQRLASARSTACSTLALSQSKQWMPLIVTAISGAHEQCRRGLPGPKASRHPRQPNTHEKDEHWLKAHPNMQFHFTPTSAFWLNQVEVWFSMLQSVSGISFTRLKQLQDHGNKAEPFVWTKKKVRSAASKAAVSLSS